MSLAAQACNHIPEWLPNRWTFQKYDSCDLSYLDKGTIGTSEIVFAVLLEAFLWGLGTAIGELPPYFVSRAARLAGQKNEELEDIVPLDKKDKNFLDKAKVFAF